MSKKKSFQPINGVNQDLLNDLQFMLVQVQQVYKKVSVAFEHVSTEDFDQFKKHEDYIDNIKTRIDSLSYDSIFKLKSKEKDLIMNYRSLIRITSNLQKIADLLVLSCGQLEHIRDRKAFLTFDISPFVKIIGQQLKRIHQGFSEVDKSIADKLLESEVALDDLYRDKLDIVKKAMESEDNKEDLLAYLFIIRYLERVGDKLMVIGESILGVGLGDSLNVKYYLKLEAAVNSLSKKYKVIDYQFKPFLFSRSGCKVGRLVLNTKAKKGSKEVTFFYKQGAKNKIEEEVEGIELWQKHFQGLVPNIVFKAKGKTHGTLVVDYFPGQNLLNYILEKPKRESLDEVLDGLCQQLRKVWNETKVKKRQRSHMMRQVQQRKKAITDVHSSFFDPVIRKKKHIDFDDMLKQAIRLERKVYTKHLVLGHGDFNLDNVLCGEKNNEIRWVDVHRSGYKDYAQEIAVFIVSCLRIPVGDTQVTNDLHHTCRRVYEVARSFAKQQDDTYFEARFTFGLFRSFVTSTRFLPDDEWYHKMRKQAIIAMDLLQSNSKNLSKLSLDLEKILLK